MKIPSISKLPKYKRFEYTPRYYDPIKDEINQKIKDAEAELEAEKNGSDENYTRRIRNGFRRRSHTERQKTDFSQSLFVLGFTGFFILYFYYGNLAFWLLAVIFPLYFWIKLRNR
jgi:hypothetical protein